jgi:hypothetical protein
MGPPDFSAMAVSDFMETGVVRTYMEDQRNRASKKSNKIVAETVPTADKKDRKAPKFAHWPFGKHRDNPKSSVQKVRWVPLFVGIKNLTRMK